MKISKQRLKRVIKEEMRIVLKEFTEESARRFNADFTDSIVGKTFRGMNYYNALELATTGKIKGIDMEDPEVFHQQNEVAHNLLLRSKEFIDKWQYAAQTNKKYGPLRMEHPEFYKKGVQIFNKLHAAVFVNDTPSKVEPPKKYPSGKGDPYPYDPPYKQEATAVMEWLAELEGLVAEDSGYNAMKETIKTRRLQND